MAFSFGNPTAPAPAFGSTGFNFGGTSAPASTSSFSFGNLGTTTTAASTGFSFNAPSATVAPFSFTGLGTTTTSAPSFGFGAAAPATTTGFTFGATAPISSTGFSFGQPTGGLGGGGGLFSTNTGMQPSTNLLGPNAPAQQSQDAATSLVTALSFPILFNDERDAIIAKWNKLQAAWGTGKGYYNGQMPPINFTPDNPFCCFKAVGYNCLPSVKAEDCLVSIMFNKKDQEIIPLQQQLIDALHKCFGSKPTVTVMIDGIKAVQEDKTEVVFYLLERLPTGMTRRVPPLEVCSYMEQPTVKPQLTNIGVVYVAPKAPPTKDQLQQYLDNPPAGLEPIVWRQAKLDNPDPEKFIPVPVIGFQQLSERMKSQDYETKQHQKRIDIISDDISELNRNHTTTSAKIAEHKRKLLELQHRILKVLVRQEVSRKTGFAIQADEEQLRIKLEAIQAELSAPTQFKGHLKELTSQIRMQNYQTSSFEGGRYCMDEVSKEEIKDQLLAQQEGISLLINIIKEDMSDLKLIEELITADQPRR